ncbi:MAG: hypothetical protein B6242_16800 [Anaerolineaceae bacterium 4572_78]|nr:MAG: hypothetical protein B6242_16800 [Anaerolineaceae bacterium 4572_78]
MIIHRLTPDDAQLACHVVNIFKSAQPTTDYMTHFLSNPNTYFYIAEIAERPVGFSLAYKLERCDEDRPMMFFYEIEVLPDYHRQGIGKALVNKLKTICEQEQYLKMFVFTNESNAPAMHLYRSTGGRQKQTYDVMFVY